LRSRKNLKERIEPRLCDAGKNFDMVPAREEQGHAATIVNSVVDTELPMSNRDILALARRRAASMLCGFWHRNFPATFPRRYWSSFTCPSISSRRWTAF
jgi:hypothetical protein